MPVVDNEKNDENEELHDSRKIQHLKKQQKMKKRGIMLWSLSQALNSEIC